MNEDEDSDGEEGPFAPLGNRNMKVYSIEMSSPAGVKQGTGGQGGVVRRGRILDFLRRTSNQKQSTEDQKAKNQH